MNAANLAAQYHACTVQAGEARKPLNAILTLRRIELLAIEHFGEILQHAITLEDTLARQRTALANYRKDCDALRKENEDLLVQILELQGDLQPIPAELLPTANDGQECPSCEEPGYAPD